MLGLRLVKKTVNFDDPTAYHLYYGDAAGSPGTILTFFYWPGASRGQIGTGQPSAIVFSAPAGSLVIDGGAASSTDTAVEVDPQVTDPDPGSGIRRIRFSTDGSYRWDSAPWRDWASLTRPYPILIGPGGGDYLILAQVEDNVGNIGTVSGTIMLDDGARQDREGVAEQDEVGRPAGRGAAALHRDPQVGAPEGEEVVHAVADHRGRLPLRGIGRQGCRGVPEDAVRHHR